MLFRNGSLLDKNQVEQFLRGTTKNIMIKIILSELHFDSLICIPIAFYQSNVFKFNAQHMGITLSYCSFTYTVLTLIPYCTSSGVRFTPTAAGHVLGAAMFSIEIDGIRVLYTGDYSMEEDRHLMCAEVPPGGPPDVLIVESTFGVVTLPARQEREARFTG